MLDTLPNELVLGVAAWLDPPGYCALMGASRQLRTVLGDRYALEVVFDPDLMRLLEAGAWAFALRLGDWTQRLYRPQYRRTSRIIGRWAAEPLAADGALTPAGVWMVRCLPYLNTRNTRNTDRLVRLRVLLDSVVSHAETIPDADMVGVLRVMRGHARHPQWHAALARCARQGLFDVIDHELDGGFVPSMEALGLRETPPHTDQVSPVVLLTEALAAGHGHALEWAHLRGLATQVCPVLLPLVLRNDEARAYAVAAGLVDPGAEPYPRSTREQIEAVRAGDCAALAGAACPEELVIEGVYAGRVPVFDWWCESGRGLTGRLACAVLQGPSAEIRRLAHERACPAERRMLHNATWSTFMSYERR